MGPCTPMELQLAVEEERRARIRISLAAYAYEFMNDSLMTDYDFDELSKRIRPSIATGNEVLDKFFKEKFAPETGMWIHDHPELDKLKALYKRMSIAGTKA